MAQIPTEKQIGKAQASTENKISGKKLSQAKQGKEFNPTGAGVIPEKTWQEFKS